MKLSVFDKINLHKN